MKSLLLITFNLLLFLIQYSFAQEQKKIGDINDSYESRTNSQLTQNGSYAHNPNKYHGGSYDGHAMGTSSADQVLGYLSTNKYHGGSYDGYAMDTSTPDQFLGNLNTDKYHGGSYDGFAMGTSTSNQILSNLTTDKYHGGSYDGFAMGTSASDIPLSVVLLAVKIFLEGSYDSSNNEMTTTLNSGGNIPTTAPYTEDNREVISMPTNITDWVLVQLRSTASGAAVVSRSSFLHKDGRIVADDGTTGQISVNVADGNYYIVVKHRNHISVMSAGTYGLSGSSSTLYDFTTGSSRFYGTSSAKELEASVWGMWSGDINQDGEITTKDYIIWYNSYKAGDSDYRETDLNLDSKVTTVDYTIWFNNADAGASSAVP